MIQITFKAALVYLIFHFNLILLASAQAFEVVQDFSGTSFFDKWDFFGNFDNLTSGDVIWLNRSDAMSQQLAFVNDAGHAIIKVDNTTDVPFNIKRNTVRITSQQSFGLGSIIVTDMLHLPFGCSVWPAFWTKGINWPADGEIDIVEAVNLDSQNQMALHTTQGCSHSPVDPSQQTGSPGQLNCNSTDSSGCTVLETKQGSFGQQFAANGGGVFATQFDFSGIFIWFWPRANVPPSLQNTTSTSPLASLADWGPPSAAYPSSNDTNGCNIPSFFDAQNIVIDITLCGTFAGAPSIYQPQCGSQGPTGLCYNDNVIGSGANYANAFFEIPYVRVYAAPGSAAATPGTFSSGSQPSSTGGDVASSSPTDNGGTNPRSWGDTIKTKPAMNWVGLVMAAFLALGLHVYA
ncbi:hypothetical protein CPC08DRAFT_670251 [Agrocybe pediades]|nr:hypothetical protein CPC08DRAFT_670251 [Agrocybe pediades]